MSKCLPLLTDSPEHVLLERIRSLLEQIDDLSPLAPDYATVSAQVDALSRLYDAAIEGTRRQRTRRAEH